MPSFKTTKRIGFPKSATKKTQENRYWDTFKPCFSQKHFGAVTDLTFSPTMPHHLYIANSMRVTVRSVLKWENEKVIVNIREEVKVVRCRADGKLVLIGGADKFVRLMGTTKAAMKRIYKGHEAAVHVADFHYSHHDSFLSAGDDKNLIQWDLISGRVVRKYHASEDFIRAGTWQDKSLYATGSYDKVVRFWDLRAPESTSIHSFKADDRVESLYYIPNTDLLVAAAGESLIIHSQRANKVVKTISDHSKTILKVTGSFEGGRLFSGSADRIIKIYETKDFNRTHQIELESPITSLAVSPSGDDFAVGHINGEMSIYRREGTIGHKVEEKDNTLDQYLVSIDEKKKTLTYGTSDWFKRGYDNTPEVYDLVIKPTKRPKLAKYDYQLKKFNYGAALDSAIETGNSTTIASVLNELWKREGLENALKNRNHEALEKIMNFVSRFVRHPHIAELALHVGGVLLKMYGQDIFHEPRLYEMFEDIRTNVGKEIDLVSDLTKLLGTASTILSLPSGDIAKESTVPLWS